MENIKDKVVTIEEMKRLYPDEWILLGNSEMDEDNLKVLAGIVICHNADKRTLCYMDKPDLSNYRMTEIFFNEVTPRNSKRVIASIFRPISG
jgi:hypothetical protein